MTMPPVTAFDEDEDALDALRSLGRSTCSAAPRGSGRARSSTDTVDVLFVDEAGQMSLANVLAVVPGRGQPRAARRSAAARSAAEGEPPGRRRASPRCDTCSATPKTMPAGRGLFLPTTWRMSPAMCAFTSELFYEGKLGAKPALAAQALRGTGEFDGSRHCGCCRSITTATRTRPTKRWPRSRASSIGAAARRVRGGWTSTASNARIDPRRHPRRRAVQRAGEPARRAAGEPGVPVGTVDKFQGQTAAVVIYSMTTSRPEDAPRGMEFLYSLNRLNVATSRARCAVFLVASPAAVRAGVPHAAADAARQRPVPVPRTGAGAGDAFMT